MDRVQALKIEDSGSGGTETDSFPTTLDPSEDYLECRGLCLQSTTSDDETVFIDRDASDNINFQDGVFTGGVSLSDVYDGHWERTSGYIKPKTDGDYIRVYDSAGTGYAYLMDDVLVANGQFAISISGTLDIKRAVATSGFVRFGNSSSSYYLGIELHYGIVSSSTKCAIWKDANDFNIQHPGGRDVLWATGYDFEYKSYTNKADTCSYFWHDSSFSHKIRSYYGTSRYIEIEHDNTRALIASSYGAVRIDPANEICEVDNVIYFLGRDGDPTGVAEGMMWFDTRRRQFRGRIGSTTYTFDLS